MVFCSWRTSVFVKTCVSFSTQYISDVRFDNIQLSIIQCGFAVSDCVSSSQILEFKTLTTNTLSDCWTLTYFHMCRYKIKDKWTYLDDLYLKIKLGNKNYVEKKSSIIINTRVIIENRQP